MKKLSKRFLTLAIACVMAMAMAVQAFADNATQVPPPPTPVEMEVESSLRDVPLQSNGPVSDCYVVPQELILADQQKAKEEAASISLVIPRSVYWQTEGSSPYAYIAQTTNYTCGLACTQMALKNINGTLPSESVLLSELGTTSSAGTNPNKIPEVLNAHQSRGTYAVRWMGSHVTTDLFKQNLWNTLTSKCSPIVHVAISESSGWQYNSTGHYLAIYSMLSDYSKVAICDPYGGYVGVNSWRWYDKETKNVYAALKHGYIYVTT